MHRHNPRILRSRQEIFARVGRALNFSSHLFFGPIALLRDREDLDLLLQLLDLRHALVETLVARDLFGLLTEGLVVTQDCGINNSMGFEALPRFKSSVGLEDTEDLLFVWNLLAIKEN